MEDTLKEVYFNLYCKTCKHRALKEENEPCNECLSNPGNINSHKPTRYVKDESVKDDGNIK